MQQPPLILNTPTCTLHKESAGHVLKCRLDSGDWLIMHPFPGDLTGLLAALNVASEILAGKFWPSRVVKGEGDGLIQNRTRVEKETPKFLPDIGGGRFA